MSETPVRYFELREVTIDPPKPGEFRIVTAAVLYCDLCSDAIDGMGGPGDGVVCVRCADVVRTGRARGAIKWEELTP